MSLLLRSTSGGITNEIIEANKGFPPGDVSNIKCVPGNRVNRLNWTDPEDTVINGVTVAKWYKTVIVRKQGSSPENIDDGTIILESTTRNQYSSSYFEDTGLSNDVMYYYRFFTYSVNDIYNSDSTMITYGSPINVSNTLNSNPWSTINIMAENGSSNIYWKVGDTKSITLSGSINESLTMEIWGFNYGDKVGGGKAGIIFGSKQLLSDTYMMRYNSSNSGGWDVSNLRLTVMKNIYDSLPSDLKPLVKQIVNVGNSGGNTYDTTKSKDYVFVPSIEEAYYSNDTHLPIFLNEYSDIKYSTDRTVEDWWLRNAVAGNSAYFEYMNSYGIPKTSKPDVEHGVSFCFCL